jgi:hypothetical protein
MATKELVSTPYGYGEIVVLPTLKPDELRVADVAATTDGLSESIQDNTIQKVVFVWGGIGYLSVFNELLRQPPSRKPSR